jgi:hypothetical protein
MLLLIYFTDDAIKMRVKAGKAFQQAAYYLVMKISGGRI